MEEVKGQVMAAWRDRKRTKTQLSFPRKEGPQEVRIAYQGVDPVSGQRVEFWFNESTGRVESAYPVGR